MVQIDIPAKQQKEKTRIRQINVIVIKVGKDIGSSDSLESNWPTRFRKISDR